MLCSQVIDVYEMLAGADAQVTDHPRGASIIAGALPLQRLWIVRSGEPQLVLSDEQLRPRPAR